MRRRPRHRWLRQQRVHQELVIIGDVRNHDPQQIVPLARHGEAFDDFRAIIDKGLKGAARFAGMAAHTDIAQDAVNKQEGGASADLEKNNNDYLSIPNGSITGLNITGALTLGGWIKIESNGFLQTLAGKWEEGSNRRQYRLYISATNKLCMDVSLDGTVVTTVTGTTTLATGTWYYVAGVYVSGTSLSVYLGTASVAAALETQNTTSIPASLHTDSGSFALGADTLSAAQNYYDGLLDDWIVWNASLTGDQVETARLYPTTPSAIGDEFTTTTTAGDTHITGVVQETIAAGARGNITTEGGIANLKVDGTTDIVVGDFLGSHTVAGVSAKVAVGSGKTAFAYALAGYTANNSNGVIRALIIAPRPV